MCAAAPNRPVFTHSRTTLVMSEPTASATVVTCAGPIWRATWTASCTAIACGLRYSDIATVGTPSLNSSTSRPMSPDR